MSGAREQAIGRKKRDREGGQGDISLAPAPCATVAAARAVPNMETTKMILNELTLALAFGLIAVIAILNRLPMLVAVLP